MSLEFLMEMGWKSAAICAVTLALLYALRSRSPADRAAVLRLSVLLLLLLPVVSLGLPKLEIEGWAETAPAPVAEALPPVALPASLPFEVESPATALAAEPMHLEPGTAVLSLGLSILVLYAAGLALVLARLLAGRWTLRRWTAGAEDPASPAWIDAFQRAVAANPLKREVRLLVSGEVPSPMSWGGRAPVILIDRASHARAADAEAILAHEMAHIRRGDWPVLMLSRLAVALFWFNPLVWLVERSLIQQAEEAADLQAVDGLEPARYAASLIACIRCSGLHAVPANGMARADGLSRRIHAVLDGRLRQIPSGSVLTVVVMLASVLVSAPLAAVKLVPARSPLAEADATPLPAMAAASVAVPVAAAAAAEAAPEADELSFTVTAAAPQIAAEAAPSTAQPMAAGLASLERELGPGPDFRPGPEHRPGRVAVAAMPQMRLALAQAPQPPRTSAPPLPPSARLDPDTLVQLKIHGVDADYIEAMQRARGARYTADQLVAMRIHGVTPERVRGYEALGLRLSDKQLLELTIHGVSADYIRGLAAAGYKGLNAAQLVKMRIHGVSAADAREGRKLGLTAEQLVRRAILGD